MEKLDFAPGVKGVRERDLVTLGIPPYPASRVDAVQDEPIVSVRVFAVWQRRHGKDVEQGGYLSRLAYPDASLSSDFPGAGGGGKV